MFDNYVNKLMTGVSLKKPKNMCENTFESKNISELNDEDTYKYKWDKLKEYLNRIRLNSIEEMKETYRNTTISNMIAKGVVDGIEAALLKMIELE